MLTHNFYVFTTNAFNTEDGTKHGAETNKIWNHDSCGIDWSDRIGAYIDWDVNCLTWRAGGHQYLQNLGSSPYPPNVPKDPAQPDVFCGAYFDETGTGWNNITEGETGMWWDREGNEQTIAGDDWLDYC